MNHIAIDLGGRESQICMRGPDGTILAERKYPTKKLESFLRDQPTSRVIVETCSEAFAVADAALAAGHQVRVVPATLVKTLGVGSRGIKTDARDAQTLSEVSCRIELPSVHIPSSVSRELRSLCGSREAIIESRTRLINNARGWLRTQLWRLRSGGTAATFPDRVRAHAKSIGRELPAHIEGLLITIDSMNASIKSADQQVKRIAAEQEVCRRLMTIPGVGPVTAVRFLAAVDDVSRFGSAHALESYLGLTPGEKSSSDRQFRTGITKAGPAPLRRTLVQGAWVAILKCPREPMVQWAMQLAARRGKYVAVVALARKIAGIMFALWRDGTTYRAARSAVLVTASES